MHSTRIVAEVRELEPEDGWARYEATGRACVVCPCGLNTGFVDKDTAATVYREHTPAGQKISITVGGGDKVMRDMIRRVGKNG